MANIRGMMVRLKTKNQGGAGTDDHIYVGIVGKGGGSEFPLDVRSFNDFEAGTDIKYWYGEVWDGTVLAGAKNPYSNQDWNNPLYRYIALDKVDYVYLRKHSHKGSNDDDAWKMDFAEVTLYGPSPQKRTFYKAEDIWLANEYGLQVYLKEEQEVSVFPGVLQPGILQYGGYRLESTDKG